MIYFSRCSYILFDFPIFFAECHVLRMCSYDSSLTAPKRPWTILRKKPTNKNHTKKTTCGIKTLPQILRKKYTKTSYERTSCNDKPMRILENNYEQIVRRNKHTHKKKLTMFKKTSKTSLRKGVKKQLKYPQQSSKYGTPNPPNTFKKNTKSNPKSMWGGGGGEEKYRKKKKHKNKVKSIENCVDIYIYVYIHTKHICSHLSYICQGWWGERGRET